jgi:hypothetical protein
MRFGWKDGGERTRETARRKLAYSSSLNPLFYLYYSHSSLPLPFTSPTISLYHRFVGSGVGTFIFTPAISVAVVRVQIVRGIELFMGCT